MRQTSLMTVLALIAASRMSAQTAQKPFQYAGSGYVYYSTGCFTDGGCLQVGAGGGGEAFLYKGLTFATDVGIQGRLDNSYFGLLSVNGGYHFTDRKRYRKFDPFVTAGYGLAFRSGAANLSNVGGGVNWWFKEKMALRTEVRTFQDFGSCCHLVLFRIGLSFR